MPIATTDTEQQTREHKAHEIRNELAQYSGTDGYHRTMFPQFLYTDGIKALAELCGAYWLIDAVVSHQPKVLRMPVKEGRSLRDCQFWTLRKHKQNPRGFRLACEYDTGIRATRQDIEYSDFPLDEIDIWVEGTADENGKPMWILLLPSEH